MFAGLDWKVGARMGITAATLGFLLGWTLYALHMPLWVRLPCGMVLGWTIGRYGGRSAWRDEK